MFFKKKVYPYEQSTASIMMHDYLTKKEETHRKQIKEISELYMSIIKDYQKAIERLKQEIEKG